MRKVSTARERWDTYRKVSMPAAVGDDWRPLYNEWSQEPANPVEKIKVVGDSPYWTIDTDMLNRIFSMPTYPLHDKVTIQLRNAPGGSHYHRNGQHFIEVGQNMNAEDANRVILHELQHGYQHQEDRGKTFEQQIMYNESLKEFNKTGLPEAFEHYVTQPIERDANAMAWLLQTNGLTIVNPRPGVEQPAYYGIDGDDKSTGESAINWMNQGELFDNWKYVNLMHQYPQPEKKDNWFNNVNLQQQRMLQGEAYQVDWKMGFQTPGDSATFELNPPWEGQYKYITIYPYVVPNQGTVIDIYSPDGQLLWQRGQDYIDSMGINNVGQILYALGYTASARKSQLQ